MRGKVTPGGQNDCVRDGGICSFVVGGQVTVIWGEGDKVCGTDLGLIEIGDEVEVYGRVYDNGRITICENGGYYIDTLLHDDELTVTQCEARGAVVYTRYDWFRSPGAFEEFGANYLTQIADMAIPAWCVEPCVADDECCQESLKMGTESENYILTTGGADECIEGYEKEQLKCSTSLEWCEPAEVSELDGSLIGSMFPIHETFSEWGPCAGPEGSCWERAILYSDGRYEVVGYQGTTTYELGDGLVSDYEALVEKLELRVENCDGQPPLPDYYRTDTLYERTEKITYPGCMAEMELVDSLIESFQSLNTSGPTQTNLTREWIDISMTEACTKEPWAPTRSQGGEGNIKTYFERAGIHVYDVRITSRGPVCEACNCPPPEIKEILIDSSDKDEVQSLLSSVVL